MSGRIGDSFSLKSSSTHSLCRYLVFTLVRHENPLSHKYVVANGINFLTARVASSGYSVSNPIQKSVRGLLLKSVFKDPVVAMSMRFSCSETERAAGAVGLVKGFRIQLSDSSSLSGKYLRNSAASALRCVAMSRLMPSARLRSCSVRNSCNKGKAATWFFPTHSIHRLKKFFFHFSSCIFFFFFKIFLAYPPS